MTYVKLFLKIIPFIIELIKAVETWFEATGAGESKKDAVMAGTKAILDGWGETVTGGAKDAWEKLAPVISKCIDFAVGIIFNFNKK
jgi:hypothetical protein